MSKWLKYCSVLVAYDWLRAWRSGDRIPVRARFFAPVQNGPGAHPASCAMGTGSFPGVKSGRGVVLTPRPFLVPWSRKGRAIPLLSLWAYGLYSASVPVQGCTLPLPLPGDIKYDSGTVRSFMVLIDRRNYKQTLMKIIHLLTPWNRVLLGKLTGSQLVKKFPPFYGPGRFITAVTSSRHLSLSWASSIQSIPPHPTYWRSILILSFHLLPGLPSGLFPSGFPTKTLYTPHLSPIRATCPVSFFSIWSPEQDEN